MNQRITTAWRIGVLLLAMGPALTWARPDAPPPEAGHQTIQAGKDLNGAVADLEKRTGGRVLAVEKVQDQGRLVYRVKLLTPDGRVRIYWLDTQGGQ